MARKIKRARKRVSKRAQAQVQRDMEAASAAEYRRRFCEEARDASQRAHGAEQARAADALAVLTALLKQVPPGKTGLITCGFSVEQARAVVAMLERAV